MNLLPVQNAILNGNTTLNCSKYNTKQYKIIQYFTN